MISASSLDRIAQCLPSEVHPHTIDITDKEETKLGTVVHAFLRDCNVLGRDDALLRVENEEHRKICAALPVADMPTCDARAYTPEVAFAYDVATGKGRVLGKDMDRGYEALLPTEIPGTADVVGLSQGPGGLRVVIVDFKTGRRVAAAKKNWQLRFLALAACKAWGAVSADVSIGYVWPGRDPWYDRAQLDDFDLMEVEADLSTLLDRLSDLRAAAARGEVLQMTIGEHCRYCPARWTCPARNAELRAVAADPVTALAPWSDVRELSREQRTEAWRRLKLMKELVDGALGALYSSAAVDPFPTADGMILGSVLETEERIRDGAKAREVLSHLYGPAVADMASKWSVSKKAVEEALRRVAEERSAAAKAAGGKRVTIKAVVDEALTEMRKAGAIHTTTTDSVKEHRPKALGAGKGRAS